MIQHALLRASARQIRPQVGTKRSIPAKQVIALSSRFYATSSAQEAATEVVKKVSLGRRAFRRLTAHGRHPIIRLVWSGLVSVVVGSSLIIGGILVFDSTTYTDRHIGRVPVNPLSLNPSKGGKKNLPIASHLVDDEESQSARDQLKKEKIVILGGGWGAVGVLKNLDPGKYHVTVVSPDNYNLFTPLLPSAAVGTVEIRSLVEPLRKLLTHISGHYLQGSAVDIDMSARLVEIDSPYGNYYLPYDRLVVSVGSVTNTHGVPGLEHCYNLKTVQDVVAIRKKIMDNLEAASLPTASEEERKRLLSFVISGGGPTGIEMASEIYDMLNEDVFDSFPKYLRKHASVHVIQSRDHILNTYSEKISQYAEARFDKNGIDTVLNARVKSVSPTSVTYTVKHDDGSVAEKTIPSGFTLWSTGIAMSPFTIKMASLLPNQYHRHALEVDSHLRVKGAPLGTIYAIGDASTIETNLTDHLLELVDDCDSNKDGKIDFDEFEKMLGKIRRKFPTSQLHVDKIRDIFDEYDKDKNGIIGLNELAVMFQKVSSKMTALPATAQVASQQGVYLGKKFSKLSQAKHDVLEQNDVRDDDDLLFDPFKYKDLGALAYIGNSAVFDLSSAGAGSWMGGLAAMYLWRSAYFSMTCSNRTRVLLMIDWVKRGIFGRDVSRF